MKKHLSCYKKLSRLPVANHGRSAVQKKVKEEAVEAAKAPASAKKAPVEEPKTFHPLSLFSPRAFWNWICSYLRYAFRRRHPFLAASAAPGKTSSCYQVPNDLKVSVAGDWGTGTDESEIVSRQMMQWSDGTLPDLTIHLGDVYYVGDEGEICEHCLGGDGDGVNGVVWHKGEMGSFALNGNHEMYANGTAYFKVLLPKLGMKDKATGEYRGQGPSFFCVENDHWRIVGIDTGYNSVGWPIISLWLQGNCKLPDELIDWLRDTVKPQEKPKGTIILSHHQYFSAFEKDYPKPARQLEEFFKTPVIWIWGHEHRLAGYDLFGTEELQVHGRCLGNGGMPVETKLPKDNEARKRLLFYDGRVHPEYTDEKFGINGFAQLKFEDRDLVIEYKSLTPDGKGYAMNATVLVAEKFRWDGSQIVRQSVARVCPDEGLVLGERSGQTVDSA